MAKRVLNISIHKLKESPYQGRILDDNVKRSNYTKKQLEELAASIESTGLMQPITVRETDKGYEIIDGHRRVAAYRMLEKGNIPAIVKEGTDREIQLMTVIANIQRSDLSNLERAMAFEKILSGGLFENKKELSRAIGKDETYVGDVLNLLKMDQRIITHMSMSKDKLTDLRLLRMIRNTHPVDESGKSDKQYKLYLKCVHDNFTRKKLRDYLEREDKPVGSFSIKRLQNGVSFRFTKKMNPKQKQRAITLLETKIKEILKGLKLDEE